MKAQICQICGKKHEKIIKKKIKLDGKWIEIEEITSPCLQAISKQATGLVNNIIRNKGAEQMNKCQEYLKAFRKVIGAKKEEKIDKRYKPYLAPNDKYYEGHCEFCAEVNYLEEIYQTGTSQQFRALDEIKKQETSDDKELRAETTYKDKLQEYDNSLHKTTLITEGKARFDRVKNQLKQDVIDFYGEDEGWTRWNKIDHLKPIHILTHFPELQDRLPLRRKDELQEISDERTRQDIATIKDESNKKEQS